MEPQIEFTDRYKATGTPYPDENSCDWCEGMGISPLSKTKINSEAVEQSHGKLIIVGQKESGGSPTEEDDFVFVRCPECFGIRKKNATDEEKLEKLRKDFNL